MSSQRAGHEAGLPTTSPEVQTCSAAQVRSRSGALALMQPAGAPSASPPLCGIALHSSLKARPTAIVKTEVSTQPHMRATGPPYRRPWM